MAKKHDDTVCDAIIIGAGFGGIRMLYELLQQGKTVRVFEAGSDVGGTWYWNRYPGARTDSESWGYCFEFSKELRADWTWTERLPSQSEVLSYLQHVVERFDLRRHMTFGTRIVAAHYDETRQEWQVTADDGATARCRYLVSATGVLSVPKQPDFPFSEEFQGEIYFAPVWPKDKITFTNKKIAIIGSAATAVQILPVIARAADQVFYLQRTPNYVLPGRNYTIPEEEAHSYKHNGDHVFASRRAHGFGLPMAKCDRAYDDVDDEERRRIFEAGWEEGGFHFCFETFNDIMTDPRSNAAAAEYVRDKIRSIVRDPATAEALCPDYPFFAKRPPSGHFYYEAFNRPNVTLVDIKNDPITAVTDTGISTASRAFDVDMIIFATGFDAATGPLMSIDVRGRNGTTIADKWKDGPRTHLGLMVDEFPNLFMIMGPQAPFGNIPTIIEGEVEWIAKVIERQESAGGGALEPSADAVVAWNEQLRQIYEATLLPAGVEVKTWFLGANIAGKPTSVLFFFGGVGPFLDTIEDVFEQGLPGFVSTSRSQLNEMAR